jgi:predicted phage tail protein
MAVPKGMILIAINKAFEGKSLSKTFKENLAEKWAVKIDNETDIDAYIEDRADIILEASTEADRRATDALRKATLLKKEEETKIDDKPDLLQDAPEWARAMIENQKALESKITGFETQQKTKSLTERFENHPDLKGIPTFMFKGRIPTSEDDFETAVNELKTDYTSFATENKLSALGMDIPNNFGNKKGLEVEKFTEEYMGKLLGT